MVIDGKLVMQHMQINNIYHRFPQPKTLKALHCCKDIEKLAKGAKLHQYLKSSAYMCTIAKHDNVKMGMKRTCDYCVIVSLLTLPLFMHDDS